MHRAFLIGAMFAVCFFPTSRLAAADKPNVLVIAIDDLNDWPKFMGRYPDAKTPHMDKLAKQGMVFTNAHCSYPLCGPSRASIFSGLSMKTLGHSGGQIKDEDAARLSKKNGSKLLYSWFKDSGYKTMAVGKLLHRHVPRGSVDMSGGRGSWNQLPGKKELNWKSNKTLTDWGAYPGKDKDMSDHQAATWAEKRLKAKHDKPFILMVGFLRPHVPWHVPQKWLDMYPNPEKLARPPYKADDLDDVSETAKGTLNKGYPRTEWALKEKKWQDIIHNYLACITFVDAQVGRVLTALEKSPYKDNTVIVLWSDHGYHMGEKNTFQKHTAWERSSRTPLIFAGPKVKAGGRCGRAVSLLDLYPTLVDMCGLPKNTKNEGRSLTPLLKDPKTEWSHPAIVHCRGHIAVQTETHRYIRYKDGSEELYDHTKDPNEWTNLAGKKEHAAILKDLASELKR